MRLSPLSRTMSCKVGTRCSICRYPTTSRLPARAIPSAPSNAPPTRNIYSRRNRMPAPIVDHAGKPVEHGRAKVNGVRIHYVTGGAGEPLFLLHGVPKTHYHWRYVIPLLTKHFTIVAPDLRGLGDSEHPVVGYD